MSVGLGFLGGILKGPLELEGCGRGRLQVNKGLYVLTFIM